MAVTTNSGRSMNAGRLNGRVGLGDKLQAINAAFATKETALATALTALNLVNRTVCFNAAGLAEGTNANTFKTTNAITYTINGTRYTKGATDNIAFTAAAAQATDLNCIYLICLDTAGTATTVKGTEVATASAAACPAPTAGTCPIGWVHIATASAATFTAGSTDLAAANVTDTFVDFVGANPATAVTAATALTTLDAALLAATPAAV